MTTIFKLWQITFITLQYDLSVVAVKIDTLINCTFQISDIVAHLIPSKSMSPYMLDISVNNQISCDDKAKTYDMIINTGLDTIAPTKEKVIITNEPPWVSLSFKKLIRNRQKAFTQGDLMVFGKLRHQYIAKGKSFALNITTLRSNNKEVVLLRLGGKKSKDYLLSLNMLVGVMTPCPC